jgi:hypothetical protein
MARKKSKKAPDPPDAEELEWLRDSHADALYHTVMLIDENAELRRENVRLLEENDRLRHENDALRRSQSSPPPSPVEPQELQPRPSSEQPSSGITTIPLASSPIASSTSDARTKAAHSAPLTRLKIQSTPLQVPPPTREQMAAYRALFRGREDVFAKR